MMLMTTRRQDVELLEMVQTRNQDLLELNESLVEIVQIMEQLADMLQV
jgi:t-SNARE complex subunit (syntaxin)